MDEDFKMKKKDGFVLAKEMLAAFRMVTLVLLLVYTSYIVNTFLPRESLSVSELRTAIVEALVLVAVWVALTLCRWMVNSREAKFYRDCADSRITIRLGDHEYTLLIDRNGDLLETEVALVPPGEMTARFVPQPSPQP